MSDRRDELKREQDSCIRRVIEIQSLLMGAKFHGSLTIHAADGKAKKKEAKAVEDIN